MSPRPHNVVAGRDDRSCRSSAELRIDRQARDIPAHEQRAAVYVRLFSVQSFTHFLARFEIGRSEEHTSELQSLMRTSYAVFCLKKKIKYNINSQPSNSKTNHINDIILMTY